MPEIHEELPSLTPKARLARKVQWHVDRLTRGTHQRGDWRLTLDDIFLADEGGTAVLELRGVTLRNGNVILPVDPHQRIVNPPLTERAAGGPILANGERFRYLDPVNLIISILREQVGA